MMSSHRQSLSPCSHLHSSTPFFSTSAQASASASYRKRIAFPHSDVQWMAKHPEGPEINFGNTSLIVQGAGLPQINSSWTVLLMYEMLKGIRSISNWCRWSATLDAALIIRGKVTIFLWRWPEMNPKNTTCCAGPQQQSYICLESFDGRGP